jgi:hypothetical protein
MMTLLKKCDGSSYSVSAVARKDHYLIAPDAVQPAMQACFDPKYSTLCGISIGARK